MAQVQLLPQSNQYSGMWIVVAASLLLHGCAALGGDLSSGPQACPATSPSKTLTAGERTITVSYKEPELQLNGQRLERLSHTTIYLEIGGRMFEYTKRSATSVRGGGTIGAGGVPPVIITIPSDFGTNVLVRVCVTATNSAGEGPPTP